MRPSAEGVSGTAAAAVAAADVDVDHWYPRCRGGPTETWNLRLMHRSCNRAKGNRVELEAERAYRVWLAAGGGAKLRRLAAGQGREAGPAGPLCAG